MGCREYKRSRRSERELAQYDQHSGLGQSVQVRRHPVEPCRPATGMAALVRRAIHRTVRLPSLFYANYTIGYDKRTFKGNAYGIGCSWGYSKLLSTRWNFIVEIGAGIVYTPTPRSCGRSTSGSSTTSIPIVTAGSCSSRSNATCHFPTCSNSQIP